MTSLHIEHTVNDIQPWLETFRSFDDFRAEGGVKAVQVRQRVDDPNYITVDLDFDTIDKAQAFLARLETQIWPHSPHFDGTPTTQVLETL